MMRGAGIEDEAAPDGESRPAPRSALARALRAAWDTLLPPRCLACNGPLDDHATLCGRCWRQIRFVHPPVCDRLGTPLPYDLGHGAVSGEALAHPPDFDRARAAIVHDGTGRRLVHLFKYSDRLEMRLLLSRWMAGAGAELLEAADLVVPVPLHRRRLIWRRYNQAAVLAQQIAAASGHQVATDLLVRRRRTPPQVGLTQAQRRDNVTGAFVVVPAGRSRLAGRRILLVDDVITTGATVNACARALKRAGAAGVDVLAVALVDARFEGPLS